MAWEVTGEPGIEPTGDTEDDRRAAEREFLEAADAYYRRHGIEIARD